MASLAILSPCHTKEKTNLQNVKFLNKQTIMMTSLAILEATATILCQFTAWLLWFATGSLWPLKFSLKKIFTQKSPPWVRWWSSFSTLYAHRTSRPQKSILSLMLDIAEIKILGSQALYSLKTAHLQRKQIHQHIFESSRVWIYHTVSSCQTPV